MAELNSKQPAQSLRILQAAMKLRINWFWNLLDLYQIQYSE